MKQDYRRSACAYSMQEQTALANPRTVEKASLPHYLLFLQLVQVLPQSHLHQVKTQPLMN